MREAARTHCQFAAGQDGHPRRATRTGAGSWPRPGAGASFRCSTGRRCASARVLLFARAGRSTTRAGGADVLKGTDLDIEVELGAGGGAQRHRLDVRPSAEYVRINARVPGTWMARPAPKDFLSILDFTPDELDRCLDLASRWGRDRRGRTPGRGRGARPAARGAALREAVAAHPRRPSTIGVGELGGTSSTSRRT